MPADIDAFKRLADTYKLKLIEDAACQQGLLTKEGKSVVTRSWLFFHYTREK